MAAKTESKVRRFGCMIECVVGQCEVTVTAAATRWGGKLHASMGCGPHQVVVKLNDVKHPDGSITPGREVAVGSESRVFMISVDDPNYEAIYTPEFAATAIGKLFVGLSKCRDVAGAERVMQQFSGNPDIRDGKLFSAGPNPKWGMSRGTSTKAAWRIGQAGGIIIIPVVPVVAACYKLGRGNAGKAITTTSESLAAAMADCE